MGNIHAAFGDCGLRVYGQQHQSLGTVQMLNPLNHANTLLKYHDRVEPYVMAADVYAVPPHTGRGD